MEKIRKIKKMKKYNNNRIEFRNVNKGNKGNKGNKNFSYQGVRTIYKKYSPLFSNDMEKDGFSKCFSLYQLLNLLNRLKKYELAGTYEIGCGFRVNPDLTYYDYKQKRPYTMLDKSGENRIVFHSHPFNDKFNCFPSIEDLNMILYHPGLIGLIICKLGYFTISLISLKKLKDLKELKKLNKFYHSISLKKLENLYVNNEIDLSEYGLSCIFNRYSDK